ncbi:MAG: hypothetical protein SYC29_03935 [Planctomycetota bacterium]|nr:hypothetical protein [Planctomycetota bacterium]
MRVCAVTAAVLAGGSCAPPATEGGFDSGNPAAKIYAIEQAVRAEDHSPPTLKAIVEQLDCDDPAVQFAAINALHRLTGRTYGFRLADPPLRRREAVQRWAQAVEGGGIAGEEPAPALGAEHDG